MFDIRSRIIFNSPDNLFFIFQLLFNLVIDFVISFSELRYQQFLFKLNVEIEHLVHLSYQRVRNKIEM